MQISDKIARTRVSGTVKLAQMARDLISAGRNVIDLSEGEPDFDTPTFIIEAAHQAALAGETRYTVVAGTAALREAIVRKFKRDNSIDYTPDQIIVGTGAKQIIFNALLTVLNPGDEVIIPAPYWVSYPDMVAIADGKPVIVDCDHNTKFKLSPEALSKSITPNTRWLIMNSPGNPCGALYTKDDLDALAGVLRQHPNVGILCDDIYEEIVFDGAQFATMAQVAPDLVERTLTVNGVSKSYAMTGWRIGYAGGSVELIAAMTKLQGQSTTNPSSIGQAAALAALEGPQDFLVERLEAYECRRDLVRKLLGDISGLTLNQPQGAFYHFIGCSDLIGSITPEENTLHSDNDISAYLLNSAGVALVPGSEFGSPGYLRLCFAKSESELMEGCNRIADAVAQLR